MRLNVVRKHRGLRALYCEDNGILCARGFDIVRIEDTGQQALLARVPASSIQRLLAGCRVTRQGLRLGIHHLWRLGDGGLLAVCKRRILKQSQNNLPFREVSAIHRGNKPASKGVVVCPDGTVLYGEYAMNIDRSLPIAVYRSTDHAESFQKSYEFPPGDIRHIHFIQWDSVEQCLWMGTGDANPECRLYRSDDVGLKWRLIGSGSQAWRAVGVAFTQGHLYWGTDAGSDAGETLNYIVRLARGSVCLEQVKEVQGPCHGICRSGDGLLFVATGVEGGRNEKDRNPHLWASKDGSEWIEVMSWMKDMLPNIVQYGVVHFPNGTQRGDRLHFTALGLRGAGELYGIGTV